MEIQIDKPFNENEAKLLRDFYSDMCFKGIAPRDKVFNLATCLFEGKYDRNKDIGICYNEYYQRVDSVWVKNKDIDLFYNKKDLRNGK